MLTLDAKSLTPAQAGKQLTALAHELGLATSVQQARCNAQAFAAVAKEKDGGKAVALELRVASCTHHKWPSA
eukprot:3991685-Prymnesium_polylepis.1